MPVSGLFARKETKNIGNPRAHVQVYQPNPRLLYFKEPIRGVEDELNFLRDEHPYFYFARGGICGDRTTFDAAILAVGISSTADKLDDFTSFQASEFIIRQINGELSFFAFEKIREDLRDVG